MSQGNSAARKRRAGGASFEPQTPAPPSRPSQGSSPTGLTLPQVIAVVDARLIKLETFMKETQQKQSTNVGAIPVMNAAYSAPVLKEVDVDVDTDVDTDEFNAKFEVLANEIADLKDIVLKLQSYTMEVNKMLMEERINVLSDIEQPVSKTDNMVTFNLSE
jgi:hypothetical protein